MGNNGVTAIGAITVTDTLPATVAFVSASGVSWTCGAAGQVVTCHDRRHAIPGNITLVVRPGVDAVPAVTNNAVVSGGGDCDLTNNATADVAVVTLGDSRSDALGMGVHHAGGAAGRRRRRRAAQAYLVGGGPCLQP